MKVWCHSSVIDESLFLTTKYKCVHCHTPSQWKSWVGSSAILPTPWHVITLHSHVRNFCFPAKWQHKIANIDFNLKSKWSHHKVMAVETEMGKSASILGERVKGAITYYVTTAPCSFRQQDPDCVKTDKTWWKYEITKKCRVKLGYRIEQKTSLYDIFLPPITAMAVTKLTLAERELWFTFWCTPAFYSHWHLYILTFT